MHTPGWGQGQHPWELWAWEGACGGPQGDDGSWLITTHLARCPTALYAPVALTFPCRPRPTGSSHRQCDLCT